MRRIPMVGDVVRLNSYSSDEMLVVDAQKFHEGHMRHSIVFTVVPFDLEKPVVNPEHLTYALVGSTYERGLPQLRLDGIQLVYSVKYKVDGTTYTFKKVNK